MTGPRRPLAALLCLALVPALAWAACRACDGETACAVGATCTEQPPPAEAGVDCDCCGVEEPLAATAQSSRAELSAASASAPAAVARLHLGPALRGPSRLETARPPTPGPSPYLLYGALLV